MSDEQDLLKMLDSLIAENDELRANLRPGKPGRPSIVNLESEDLSVYVAVEKLRRKKESAKAACERLNKDLNLQIDLLSCYNRGKKIARRHADGSYAKEPVHAHRVLHSTMEDHRPVYEFLLKIKARKVKTELLSH